MDLLPNFNSLRINSILGRVIGNQFGFGIKVLLSQTAEHSPTKGIKNTLNK